LKGAEELAGKGLTPLLPFYIVRLRKEAKRAKTDEERRRVEEAFRELGFKLAKTIEGSARGACQPKNLLNRKNEPQITLISANYHT
jgi:hypothetical protein